MLLPPFFLLGHLIGDLLGFSFPIRVLLLHKTLDVLHVPLPLLVLLLDDLFQSVAVVLLGKGDVTFKSERKPPEIVSPSLSASSRFQPSWPRSL